MSFVQTLPEALAAAAAQLEGIGNSFSAESAGAAGPTTAIAQQPPTKCRRCRRACSLPTASSIKRSAPKPRPFISSS